jgi:hypothetical protein
MTRQELFHFELSKQSNNPYGVPAAGCGFDTNGFDCLPVLENIKPSGFLTACRYSFSAVFLLLPNR